MRVGSAIAVLILALALIAAGCQGGGDREAGGDAETTVATETTPEDTTTVGTGSDPGTTTEPTTEGNSTDEDEPSSDALNAAACRDFRAIGADIGRALSGSEGSAPDFAEARRLFDRLAERAPEKIRADVELLGAFLATYAETRDRLDLEPGEEARGKDVAELQRAVSSADADELRAASLRLTTWAQADCGHLG